MSEHRWVIRTLDAPQRRLLPPTDFDDITYEFETRDLPPEETHLISRSDCLHGPVAAVGLCVGEFDIIRVVDLSHVLKDLPDKLLYDALIVSDDEINMKLTEAVMDLEDEVADYFMDTCRRDALAEGIDEAPVFLLSYKPDAVMDWLKVNRPEVHNDVKTTVDEFVEDILNNRHPVPEM
jgi:hypothetical protein